MSRDTLFNTGPRGGLPNERLTDLERDVTKLRMRLSEAQAEKERPDAKTGEKMSEDIEKIARVLHDPQWGISASVSKLRLARAISDALSADRTDETDPMPVFTIKAKDNFSLGTIAFYRELCREHGLSHQAVEVEKAYNEMRDWRARHPDRMKLPDHDHIPVRNTMSDERETS